MAGDAVIGALRVVFGADTAALEDGIKRASSQLSNFGKKIQALQSGITFALVTQAFRAVQDSVGGTIEAFDQMGKTAQKVGIPVDELSKLSVAAELSEVSMESLSKGLGFLSKSMLEASRGNEKAVASFKRLGIEVKNTDGSLKSTTQVLGELADSFKASEDGAAKTGTALALLGRRGGKELIPLLNEGSASLAEFGRIAERMGLVILPETAALADKFGDNLQLLSLANKGLINTIVKEMLPALVRLSDGFAESAKSGERLKTTGEIIIDALKSTTGFIFQVVAANELLGKAMNELFLAVGAAGRAVREIFERLKDAAITAFTAISEAINRSSGFWAVLTRTALAASPIIRAAFEVIGAGVKSLIAAMPEASEQTEGLSKAWAVLLKAFESPALAEMLDRLGNFRELLGVFTASMTAAAAEAAKLFEPLNLTGNAAKKQAIEVENAKNAIDGFIKSTEKSVASLRAEVMAFGQSAAVRERLRLLLEAEAIAKANDITLTDRQRAAIAALATEQGNLALKLEGLKIIEDTLPLWERYQAEVDKTREKLIAAGADLETFERVNKKTAEKFGLTWEQQSASIAGSMAEIANVFGKENKRIAATAQVFSAAQALISTYAGAAEALKNPFPFNLAFAAAVLAKGLAFVAAIKSVVVPSAAQGGTFKVPGGLSATDNKLIPMLLASGEEVSVSRPEQRRPTTFNINLQGETVSRNAMRELFETINAGLRDGHRIKLVEA
jgi:hypothetical protein